MRAFLTIEDRWAARARDVVVDAHPDATLGALVDVVEPEGTETDPWRVNGRLVPRDARVADALRDGAVLVRGGPTVTTAREAADRLVELRVVGGPDAGMAWRLAPGRYVIGRGEEADLQLGADVQASRRHAIVTVTFDGVDIEDASSANGILVGGRRAQEAHIAPGENVQLGESVLSWAWPAEQDAVMVPDRAGGLRFNRPPRIEAASARPPVALPKPPVPRPRAAFPIAAALAPLALGIVMALALHQAAYLLFTLLSPVIAVSNHLADRRRGTRSFRNQRAEFEQERARARAKLRAAVERETAELRGAFPDPAEVASVARVPRSRLWERRRVDDDFAVVRLGLVDRPASVDVVGGADDGAPAPGAPVAGAGRRAGEALAGVADNDADAVLRQVPATLDLAQSGVLGIAGPRESCQALARWLVGQAAVFHAPDDLAIAVLTGEHQQQAWSWARWLPHLRAEDSRVLVRIGNTDTSVVRVASGLAAMVDERLRARELAGERGGREDPLVLVVLDGAYRLGAYPAVTRLLRHGPEVGVVAIALDESERLLPEECRTTAVFSPDEPTRCALRATREAPISDVLADLVAPEWGEQVARALSPVRLSRRSDDAAVLPTSLRLLDLLGIEPPSPDAVVASWNAAGRTTAALVGATTAGAFGIDLRRDGPHALVAGTTGSGKSEFLQTLIASLAFANRPDAMTFVLVDYKGGSAFKDCAELPHTVGTVTDLDGHLTERALVSLAAELRRRERIFQLAGAKDIDDYWRATAAGGGETLARLVLVIDEFAALAEELPGFVDGLVDLARRGRSLGIHLVLATQRPSGVVSPAIKTNTNLRVAMRVTDAGDSIDVIDSPLAARIPKDAPGRGFVRVGHEQLSEFQAARIGGRRPLAALTDEAVAVHEVGWRMLGEEPPRAAPGPDAAEATDLAELVESVRQASTALGTRPVPSPWLPPLPDFVMLDELGGDRSRLQVPYGLEDLPSEQSRGVAHVDLEHASHLLAAGDAGSGRSTFLRTLAGSLAERCGPEDVHLYGIDCGNGALLALSELPHCGAVVSRVEPERVDRLLSKLLGEVARRQQRLALGGFASISDQRGAVAAGETMPYIVLLLDRFEGFVAAFDTVDNGRLVTLLLQLMREAPGVGVRVVLTGDRSALSGRLASLVENIVLLRLNDRSAYSLGGLNPRDLPDSITPGRGFRAQSGVELQIALLDPDPAGPAQVAALGRIAAEARTRAAGLLVSALPEPIGVLPQRVSLATVRAEVASGAHPEHPGPGALVALVGVGGDRLVPQHVDLLAHGGGFLVGGPARSGRSNALDVIARSLLERQVRVIAVAPRRSVLSALEGAAGVLGVFSGRDAPSEALVAMLAGVEVAAGRVAVIVDDAELLSDAPAAEALARFARAARDHESAMVVGGTTADLAAGFRGFVPEVRKTRAGLLLCPGSPADGELLGVRLPRTALFPGPPGRGLLLLDGTQLLVQVPLDDESSEPRLS